MINKNIIDKTVIWLVVTYLINDCYGQFNLYNISDYIGKKMLFGFTDLFFFSRYDNEIMLFIPC